LTAACLSTAERCVNEAVKTDEAGRVNTAELYVGSDADKLILLLSLHHAICDGLSGTYLLGEVAAAMSTPIERSAKVGPVVAVAKARQHGLPATLTQRVGKQYRWAPLSPLYHGLRVLHMELRGMAPYRVIPVLKPAKLVTETVTITTRLLISTMEPEAFAKLRKACRSQGVTINAAINAALAVAGYAATASQPLPNDVLLRTSADVRKVLRPPIPPGELGYFVSNLSCRHHITPAQFELATSTDGGAVRAFRSPNGMARAFGWAVIRDWIAPFMSQRITDPTRRLNPQLPATILSTNVGDVSAAFSNAQGGGTGTMSLIPRAALFASSGNTWQTPEVSAATLDGRLTLAFVCPVTEAGLGPLHTDLVRDVGRALHVLAGCVPLLNDG
jgi:hypothetical protein